MNQLLSFLKLEALKGIRTKLLIGVYVVLVGLVQTHYISQSLFNTINGFLIPIGLWFGVEHFENK